MVLLLTMMVRGVILNEKLGGLRWVASEASLVQLWDVGGWGDPSPLEKVEI